MTARELLDILNFHMDNMLIYISQSFIIIGYLIFFVSRFRNSKKSILMTDTISRICFIVGYYLFGSANSIEHTIYGIIRNVIGQSLINRSKTHKILSFIVMSIVLCIMYSLSFNGVSTVMFILSGLINLLAAIFAKEQGIRLGTVIASICNITAFLLIGSYASLIGEALCGIIGILSYKKEQEAETSGSGTNTHRCQYCKALDCNQEGKTAEKEESMRRK